MIGISLFRTTILHVEDQENNVVVALCEINISNLSWSSYPASGLFLPVKSWHALGSFGW